MLDVRQLSCTRDDRQLFHDLSFTVSPGELIQIEGPNGAGKTSLLRILSGLGLSDEGEVRWKDFPIHQNREMYHQDLLYLGHLTGVKRELTAYENLFFYQKMHCRKKDEDRLWKALIKAGLAGREDVPAFQLSAGQNRRIALARFWVSDAPLWILDEPLTAIDKHGVTVLENTFQQHVSEGGMVIFTTHQDLLPNNQSLRRISLGG